MTKLDYIIIKQQKDLKVCYKAYQGNAKESLRTTLF